MSQSHAPPSSKTRLDSHSILLLLLTFERPATQAIHPAVFCVFFFMHFGRSHARSKSRSPAPAADSPIYTPQSTRPHAFLPPSHYAAAAGLPVSGDMRTSFEQYSPALDHSSIAYPALDETPSPDSADTASHFGAVGRLIGRNSGKRSIASLARSDSKGDKDRDLRDKRKSQFGGLPLLEAHLLPSLRDTVDRMTQSPKYPIDQSESAESYQAPPTLSSLSTRVPRSTPEPPSATNIPRLRTQASPTPKSALKSPSRRGVPNTTPSISSPQPPPFSSRTPRISPRDAQPELGTGVRQYSLDHYYILILSCSWFSGFGTIARAMPRQRHPLHSSRSHQTCPLRCRSERRIRGPNPTRTRLRTLIDTPYSRLLNLRDPPVPRTFTARSRNRSHRERIIRYPMTAAQS